MTDYAIEIVSEDANDARIFVGNWGLGSPTFTDVVGLALRYATQREAQENLEALRAQYPARYRIVEIPVRPAALDPYWRPAQPEQDPPDAQTTLALLDEIDAMLPQAGTHQPGTVAEKRFRDRAKAIFATLASRGVETDPAILGRFGLFRGDEAPR